MSHDYWEAVYLSKEIDQVSWYQAQDDKRIALIQRHNLQCDSNIIDVGSGSSVLLDQLIEHGYKNIYALDLSKTALAKTQTRLNAKGLDASQIRWCVDDVCTVKLPQQYFDLWHDRAVFHFMMTDEQQQQYLDTMRSALKKAGLVMISTFAEDGPTQCSGLATERYSIQKLKQKLGEDYQLLDFDHEQHVTPWGSPQNFLNSLWRFEPERS